MIVSNKHNALVGFVSTLLQQFEVDSTLQHTDTLGRHQGDNLSAGVFHFANDTGDVVFDIDIDNVFFHSYMLRIRLNLSFRPSPPVLPTIVSYPTRSSPMGVIKVWSLTLPVVSTMPATWLG